ncbi:MAG: DUF5666 domain-containing protein [Paracoccaceae bacterium]
MNRFQWACSAIIAIALLAGLPVLSSDRDDAREGGLTGTGIVGEVTALGSIIVNGQRITFDPDLPVAQPLDSKLASALSPGEVVAVAVTPSDEDWDAQAITQVYPLIGPVGAIGPNGLTVLGSPVQVAGPLPSLNVGDWVAVSGFWNRGTVTATVITPIAPQEQASIQGSYRTPVKGEALRIGGTTLDGVELQHANDGDIIRAAGIVQNGGLQVTDVFLGLFDAPVDLVLAEGYFSSVDPTGHYTLVGTGLSSFTENLDAVMPDSRAQVCGIGGRMIHGLPDITATDRDRLVRLGCTLP